MTPHKKFKLTSLLPVIDTYGYGISPQLGLVGICCMLTGMYFMAFGFRCFRATLALTGFIIFGKQL